MKKILTSILTLLLSLSVLQAQSDDLQLINITTLAQLNAIRYDMDGNGTVDSDANAAIYKTAFPDASAAGVLSPPSGVTFAGYELMNDLDFKNGSMNTADFSIWAEGSTAPGAIIDVGWESIGDNSSRFTAIFEGNGHRISNLYINRESTSYVGLFGYVSGSSAKLRNIGLLDVNVKGENDVGGLVGYNGNAGNISGSYATGAVVGGREVGGLVGRNNEGTVSNSYAVGAVTAMTTESRVGGLVGYNGNAGDISNSYAMGAVTGTNRVGGLVGFNAGDISGSYATGAVTGTGTGNQVGGLVGYNAGGTVSNSYATGLVAGSSDVGGLVGSNVGSSTITASYYNSQTTGQDDTGKGEGKTTTELLTPTDYTGIYVEWDDDTDYWNFGTNGQYPVLKIDVNGNGTAGDANDLALQRPVTLTVSPTSLDFTAMGGGMEFTITRNVAWTVNSDRVWLTLDNDSGSANMTITATAQENSGAERMATITITYGTLTQTVTVTQAHSDDSELINITTLAQLNAIRYDLDGRWSSCLYCRKSS